MKVGTPESIVKIEEIDLFESKNKSILVETCQKYWVIKKELNRLGVASYVLPPSTLLVIKEFAARYQIYLELEEAEEFIEYAEKGFAGDYELENLPDDPTDIYYQ